MKNVLEWLEESALKVPDKTVFESKDESITFSQVQDLSKRIGSSLLSITDKNTPIATMLDRNVKTINAYLGIVYSGCAYAPIDSSLPDDRVVNILSTLRCGILITNNDHKDKAEQLISKIGIQCDVLLYDELVNSEINECALNKVRSNMVASDPLYIIFTSGSSGKPKGVITSHFTLINYIKAYTAVMEINDTDRIGSQSPLDYIAAIRDIYIPLYKSAYSFIIPKELFMQPPKLVNVMNEMKITSLGWSASALIVLSKMNIFQHGTMEYLKKICFSGSVLPSKVLREWQINLPDAVFVNQYGPTEATASCTYYKCTHTVDIDESIPIGVPYDNYKIILIKPDNTQAVNGEIGEICVGGPVLALGYYGDPERTSQAFVQNPLHNNYVEFIYKTGDLGLVNENGQLEYHGRIDRQIKHLGHRVELEEIEVAAMQLENVDESAVVYDEEKEILFLFYSGALSEREVAIGLRKKLPGFMVPRKITKIDGLPKLPNSKIDYQSLKKINEKE